MVSTHDEAIEGTTAIDKELAEARTNNEVATRKAEEARAKLEAQRAVLEKAQVNVTKASVAKRLADDDFALKSAAFKLAETDMGEVSRKCGEAWKALTDDEKEVWKKKANEDWKERDFLDF